MTASSRLMNALIAAHETTNPSLKAAVSAQSVLTMLENFLKRVPKAAALLLQVLQALETMFPGGSATESSD
jgi:predicted RNA-binding Zn ribbon-like protein